MLVKHRQRLVIGSAGLLALILATVLGLPAAADLNLVGGDDAEVAYTDGAGINVRPEPGLNTGILTTLPEAFSVTVLDGPLTLDDGTSWYLIGTDTNEGWVEGWVIADYLAGAATQGATNSLAVVEQGTVMTVSAGLEGLNLRSGAALDAGVLIAIPDGAVVELLAADVAEQDGLLWSEVYFEEYTGFVASDFLASQPVATMAVESFPAGTVVAVSGTGGVGVNVRSAPDINTAILTSTWEGSSIQVLDGPVYDAAGEAWYEVAAGDASGWVRAAYLSETTSSATAGVAFLSTAYEYLGTPYLWGGQTPEGFDCSGFTYYILNQIYGYDFPRAIEQQMEMGVYVAWENLMPGDLIFFENTYQPGLSHVGFYIGDGQFISATSEHNAVGISDLNSEYWSTRYLTARRVG